MPIVDRFVRSSKRLAKAVLRPALGMSDHAARTTPPEHWGLTGASSGALSLDSIELRALGQRFGTPLHVVNAARLRRNAARFLASPPGSETGCEVFYSYKTNPVPGVLSELHKLGVGAEVISEYELWLALKLGVPPEKIVFNGPAKSTASVRTAIAAGIGLFNFNHREEIQEVVRSATALNRTLRVGVRVTVGTGWTGQFGVPVDGGGALAAYEEALRSPSLNVVGLHAHRGGMIRSEGELVEFVRPVLAFADELYARLGLSVEVIDFGGSLGTPTVRSLSPRDLKLNRAFQRDLTPPDADASLSIDRYVAIVTEMVNDFYRRRGRVRPRIFLEPGRAITGDAQMLLATVVSLKNDGGAAFAILDAGINLAESCRSEYHQLFSADQAGAPRTHVYTVVGPICTPGDTLYWAARMPRLEPGHSVVIMDAGAYFVPFSTAFSFPRPAVVLVDNGTISVLRRAEQFDDLVACDEVGAISPG